jgi:hypothetical protein
MIQAPNGKCMAILVNHIPGMREEVRCANTIPDGRFFCEDWKSCRSGIPEVDAQLDSE